MTYSRLVQILGSRELHAVKATDPLGCMPHGQPFLGCLCNVDKQPHPLPDPLLCGQCEQAGSLSLPHVLHGQPGVSLATEAAWISLCCVFSASCFPALSPGPGLETEGGWSGSLETQDATEAE